MLATEGSLMMTEERNNKYTEWQNEIEDRYSDWPVFYSHCGQHGWSVIVDYNAEPDIDGPHYVDAICHGRIVGTFYSPTNDLEQYGEGKVF